MKAPHGTYAGAQEHAKYGETACPSCRDARNAYMRDYRRTNPTIRENNKRNRATAQKAIRKLRDRHRAERTQSPTGAVK